MIRKMRKQGSVWFYVRFLEKKTNALPSANKNRTKTTDPNIISIQNDLQNKNVGRGHWTVSYTGTQNVCLKSLGTIIKPCTNL